MINEVSKSTRVRRNGRLIELQLPVTKMFLHFMALQRQRLGVIHSIPLCFKTREAYARHGIILVQILSLTTFLID
jgi:hypothetical protein